ncbi:MAG: hypothetical protein JW779_06125 [Candidatus Thorarchaeota archaeon]|nr:hypothetical protein [Candidatus Thorarchaeota archaeon]
MRRSPSKILFFGIMTVFIVALLGSYTVTTTTAQLPSFPDDFLHDDTLYVYTALDGENVLEANSQSAPIVLNTESPMLLTLQINVSSTHDLNMSGTIVFYYQGIPIFPIVIVEPGTNSSWIWVPHDVAIPVVEAYIDFSSILNYGPLQLITGIIQAAIDFNYYVEGDATLHTLQSDSFYFSIPATPTSVFTSVTGISASIATVGAVVGVGNGFMSLFEGLKTAYKLRGIHKKASEIRSLPNLTVIGALPLLFSMLAGMMKIGKKKDVKIEESREDGSVSEYIIRQRLREVAPDAWPVDKCPKCKKDWNKKLDMCKKCNFTQTDAREYYSDLLVSKVPSALKVMGKKKSSDIRTLAKKTKSTDYNAGVIAAAMVDTGVTEIVKVGTPFRSFVMNIAGLAFLVVTWQQLLGDSASTFQTTITIVGAAMSLGVIIALYVSRKTQIQKFQSDMDAGKKWMPTEEEAKAEAVAEESQSESSEESESASGEDIRDSAPDDARSPESSIEEEPEHETVSHSDEVDENLDSFEEDGED